MASKPCIHILAILQQSRSLVVDASSKGSQRIVSRDETLDANGVIRTLTQIGSANGMNVVAAIRLADCTGQALIDVSFGSEKPSVLS